MSKSFSGHEMECECCKKTSTMKSPLTRASDIDIYGPYWPWYLRAVKHLLCRFPKQKRCLICLTIFRIHSTQCRDSFC